MAAPEKIYLYPSDRAGIDYDEEWLEFPLGDNSIEYTRTDTLINKVAIWFNNNFMVHDDYGVISDSFDTKEEMFEDFKNCIKGDEE